MDGAGYIEYHAGTLPLILAAPHGGILQPTSIPNRDPESYLPKEGGADTEIVKQVIQCGAVITLNFLPNPHKMYPIAFLLGWDMGCLLCGRGPRAGA